MAVPSYWLATSSKIFKLPTIRVEGERLFNQLMIITNISINPIKRYLNDPRLPLVQNLSNLPWCKAVWKPRHYSKPMGDHNKFWVTRETIRVIILRRLKSQVNLVLSHQPIFLNDRRFKMWRSRDTIKYLAIKNKWCNNSITHKLITHHKNRFNRTWRLRSLERRAWVCMVKF